MSELSEPCHKGDELHKGKIDDTHLTQAHGCFTPANTDMLHLPRYEHTSYPLGKIELTGFPASADTVTLSPTSAGTIEEKIRHKAEDEVRKNMTPQEIAQLDSDQAKWAIQQQEWQLKYEEWHRREMRGTGGIDYDSAPKSPEEPASVKKYDDAVDVAYKRRIAAEEKNLNT